MSFKDHAPGLRALGFSVFPTHAPSMPVKEGMDEKQIGKAPLVKWKPYQTVAPDADTLKGWSKKFPAANIAICCGPVSGLLILDVDGMEAMNALEALQDQHGDLPDTWRVATSRGQHIYFKYDGDDLRNTNGELGKGIESKTLGSTCHAAGSVHRTGHIYDWIPPFSPAECALAPLPDWLAGLLRKKPTVDYTPPPAAAPARKVPANQAEKREDSYKRKAWAAIIGELAVAPEGTRNATFFRVAAKAREAANAGVIGHGEAEQALMMQARAIGLDELEIKTTMQSAFRKVQDKAMRLPDFTAERPGHRSQTTRRVEGPMPPEPPPYDPETGEILPQPEAAQPVPGQILLPPPEHDYGIPDSDDVQQEILTLLQVDDLQTQADRPITRWCANREYTDYGNAQRLVAWFGQNIMYSDGTDWMVWDGKCWRRDPHAVYRFAHRAIYRLRWEEQDCVDETQRKLLVKHFKNSQGSGRLDAMIKIARSMRTFETDTLDADPFLLNTQSGIVNLKTGEVLPHNPDARMTKMCPYEVAAPGTVPEKFLKFLSDVSCGDDGLMDFHQKSLGYALTGSTEHHALFFYYGFGSNGKSTLIEIMQEIMGTYAVTDNSSLLLDKLQSGNIEYRMIRLLGARALFLSEIKDGETLDMGVIKRLTGSDRMIGRHLNKSHVEWRPTHKIFLASNHQPTITDQTTGTWRRMKLIPFTASFEGKAEVRNMKDILLSEEGPAILRWLIDGAALGYGQPLPAPAVVLEATASYKEDEDALADFLSDNFVLSTSGSEQGSEVYDAFIKWCRTKNEIRMAKWSVHYFSKKMHERGFARYKSNGRRKFRGIVFRDASDRPWCHENQSAWQREF